MNTELNYSDGDRVMVMAGKTPLTFVREKGGSWRLTNLSDFTIDAYIKAGKAEMLS